MKLDSTHHQETSVYHVVRREDGNLDMEQTIIVIDLLESGSFFNYEYSTRWHVPILYEDNHLIIAVKPAGVLSQADGSDKPDMLTVLKSYIKQKYDKPGDVFLGLLHRLDCPVAGVMVFARTSKSASRISEQIRERTVDKRYLAVVQGRFNKDSGRLVAKLSKKAGNIVEESEDGKESALSYRVLQYNAALDRSLLEVHLETGRTHQIRYQFAAIGHPLFGDAKYGDDAKYRDRIINADNIALFSTSFSFIHPVKDSRITVKVLSAEAIFRKDFKEYFEVYQ